MLLQYFGKKKKAAHSLYNAITIEITSEVVSNRTSSLQFERVLAFKLVRDRRRILRDNCEIVDISGDIFVVVSPITHPDISFGHGCSESHFGEDIRESLPPSCPAGSQAIDEYGDSGKKLGPYQLQGEWYQLRGEFFSRNLSSAHCPRDETHTKNYRKICGQRKFCTLETYVFSILS